jgi:hypothetical protein
MGSYFPYDGKGFNKVLISVSLREKIVCSQGGAKDTKCTEYSA